MRSSSLMPDPSRAVRHTRRMLLTSHRQEVATLHDGREVLVVQGARDPFGMPPRARRRKVVAVPGDHGLRDTAAVEAAIAEWLPGLV